LSPYGNIPFERSARRNKKKRTPQKEAIRNTVSIAAGFPDYDHEPEIIQEEVGLLAPGSNNPSAPSRSSGEQ
jgi:hypothetical protein